MPRQAGSLIFPTYNHLLQVLLDGATVLIKRLGAEGNAPDANAILPFRVIARHFAVLAAIIRRTTVVSNYLQTQPASAEERNNRVLPALDRVFTVFARHRIDVDAYHAAMDAEIGAADAELDGTECFATLGALACENADVPGRPPAALVGELCRDFGMLTHALPVGWLAPIPSDLRLLCARAAAASIRPGSKPGRVDHLMEP